MKVLILCFILAIPNAFSKDREVNVSGQCSRKVIPDKGSIQVTVEIRDFDIKKASNKATQIYEQVRKRVSTLQLKDAELSTSEFVLDEVREWENNKSVSKGFRARYGLRVESSDIKKLADVSSIAIEEGMKEISQLSMFISKSKYQEAYGECLKTASESAKTKAQKMVEGLGLKLGELLILSEGGGNYNPRPPMPQYRMAKTMMADAAEGAQSPSIDQGSQDVEVSVSATFSVR